MKSGQNSEVIPTPEEIEVRHNVIAHLLELINQNQTVKLPQFDPTRSATKTDFPFATVGIEANSLGGSFGEFRYQFEGEEDLLHLIVTRNNQTPLTPGEGVAVAEFVLDGIPKGLVRFRPGDVSQHFFLGHENLRDSVVR